MRRLFLALCAFLMLATTHAAAQSAAEAKLCGPGTDHARIVASCNRILTTYKLTTNNRALFLWWRAVAYVNQSDMDRGLSDIEAAIKLVPDNPAFYIGRAQVFLQKGNFQDALDSLDEVLRRNPKNAVAYALRGQILVNMKNPTRALQDIEEAIRLDPKIALAYNARGLIALERGELDKAIADFDTAIKLDANGVAFYSNRGSAFYHKRELTRALADLDQALKLDPKRPEPYRYRGLVFAELGEFEKARGNLRQALALNPTYDRVHDDLAKVERDAAARTAAAASPSSDTSSPAAPSSAPSPAASSSSTTAALTPVPPPFIIPTPTISATPEIRVALVISNSTYDHVARLANPENDARAVEETLRNIGFNGVQTVSNLRRDAMISALKRFAAEAEGADWAVIYYAGHGIEVGGVNWLVPVDAALKSDRDVQFEAVPVEQILGAAEGAKKLSLIVLDACRDNPFVTQMRVANSARAVGRGLAPIEPHRGTVVFYSAKHGQIAMDGSGPNSPFVSALVQHMRTPGLEINKVFRLVRDDVLNATNARQEPFVYGTLPAQDFYFAGQ